MISLNPRASMRISTALTRSFWSGQPRLPRLTRFWSGLHGTPGGSCSSQLRSKRHTHSFSSPIRRGRCRKE